MNDLTLFISSSDVARLALTEAEVRAIEAFCTAIRDGSHSDMKKLLQAAEGAEELPFGYVRGATNMHDQLLDLLGDIVDSIP